MSNNQAYLDNGQLRDVRLVAFDRNGNLSDQVVKLGQAKTYADALAIAKDAGYSLAPEGEGYDGGHIANPDGPDAYGVAVLV